MSAHSETPDRVQQPTASMQSFDLEMEDIAGLRISDWFKQELQGQREVQVRASVVSATAKCEILAGLDLAAIVVAKDVRYTFKLASDKPWGKYSGRLRVQPHSLRMHLDFGNFAYPQQILNPYLAVTVPRNSSLADASVSASVGAVYYFKDERRDARHAIDVTVDQKLMNPEGLPVILTQNLSLKQQSFDIGVRHQISFAGSLTHESRLVVSKEAPRYSGYAQVGLNRSMKISDFGFGAWWRPWLGLSFFMTARREIGKSLLDDNKSRCPVTKTSLFLKDYNLAAGLEFEHTKTGFAAKLGYIHRDRLTLSASTPRNLGLRGVLLMDQQLTGDANKFGWGARVEFDC